VETGLTVGLKCADAGGVDWPGGAIFGHFGHFGDGGAFAALEGPVGDASSWKRADSFGGTGRAS
jgi:hypothetical protein